MLSLENLALLLKWSSNALRKSRSGSWPKIHLKTRAAISYMLACVRAARLKGCCQMYGLRKTAKINTSWSAFTQRFSRLLKIASQICESSVGLEYMWKRLPSVSKTWSSHIWAAWCWLRWWEVPGQLVTFKGDWFGERVNGNADVHTFELHTRNDHLQLYARPPLPLPWHLHPFQPIPRALAYAVSHKL